MKLLKDILYKIRITDVVGVTNVAIEKIVFDSRKAEKLCLFVAVRGTQTDGHLYIDTAIKNGTSAIICEELPQNLVPGVTYVKVTNCAEALGIAASNFYDDPSEKLKLIGVTGTNGKTTNVTLLHRLFRLLGHKVGMLSTVENKINEKIIPSTHTTPDPIQLNQLLNQMVEEGCTHCFMEVSSHAVHQHRISGLQFHGAVFTNITHDHLDYHKTFDEYIAAKKMFFDVLPSSAFALSNKDDKNGEIMLQNTKAKKVFYSIKGMADFKAKILENRFTGLTLMIDGEEFWSKLIGTFNAYNLLSVYATAILAGERKLDVLTELSKVDAARGRFQFIKTESGISAIVDYAHTPDALQNVLATIKDIRTGNEQLITIVGCGGDRDKSKRPVMAEIACELSTKVILTSDNPRSEKPETIIEDMKKGVPALHFKKVLAIIDRKEAIKTACKMANKGDIILIAGKGHETYQEINGVKHDFDDAKIVSEMLKMLEK